DFPDEWIDEVSEADPLPDDLDLDDEPIPVEPPLAPDEIDSAHLELARWQSADAFQRIEKSLRLRNTSPDFFLQPQLKFL
ncbi:hypothetical protein QIG44_26770, partial [Klebsiella pneumoniae]|nr:hypothetical protein [Klebsiella pneumoniae]